MSDSSKIFLDHKEVPLEKTGEGIERQIMGYDKALMLMKVRFEEGAVGSLHHHPHVQSSFIVSGKFNVTVGEDTHILSAGDGFFVPPGVLHGTTCIEAGEIIDSFSPYREDFIK